jgi:hypothetical protein
VQCAAAVVTAVSIVNAFRTIRQTFRTPYFPAHTERAGVADCASAKVLFEKGCVSAVTITVAVEVSLAGIFSGTGIIIRAPAKIYLEG